MELRNRASRAQTCCKKKSTRYHRQMTEVREAHGREKTNMQKKLARVSLTVQPDACACLWVVLFKMLMLSFSIRPTRIWRRLVRRWTCSTCDCRARFESGSLPRIAPSLRATSVTLTFQYDREYKDLNSFPTSSLMTPTTYPIAPFSKHFSF